MVFVFLFVCFFFGGGWGQYDSIMVISFCVRRENSSSKTQKCSPDWTLDYFDFGFRTLNWKPFYYSSIMPHVGLNNVFAITFLQGLTEALISVDGVNRRLAIASLWLGSVLLSRVRFPSSCSTKVALLNEESNRLPNLTYIIHRRRISSFIPTALKVKAVQ